MSALPKPPDHLAPHTKTMFPEKPEWGNLPYQVGTTASQGWADQTSMGKAAVELPKYYPSAPQTDPQNPATESLQKVDNWGPDKLELLKATVAKGLTTDQFLLFVELCKSRRLNPFNNQVYAIVRGGKLTVTTAIDGYRLIAQRSGEYRGQLGPYWCGADGVWKDVWLDSKNPAASKVGVLREKFLEPVWGTALWGMYASTGPFWTKGAAHMLAKVAEALALKKAFPEELSGLYTTEEMDNDILPQGKLASTQVVEEANPALIFVDKIKQQWNAHVNDMSTTYSLVVDSNKKEWLFTGADQVKLVDLANTQGTPLLVVWVEEQGRKLVTSIEKS